MIPSGHFYDEDGVMHFTAKLKDFLPAHTRRFSRPAEGYEELLGFRSVSMDQVMEQCSRRTLFQLGGDLKEWGRFLLCGPTEPRFAVRFTIFREPLGPVLAHCAAGSFTSATFASKAGARYETIEQLAEALDCVGLPSEEICSFTTKVYYVTAAQLRVLRLTVPTN